MAQYNFLGNKLSVLWSSAVVSLTCTFSPEVGKTGSPKDVCGMVKSLLTYRLSEFAHLHSSAQVRDATKFNSCTEAGLKKLLLSLYQFIENYFLHHFIFHSPANGNLMLRNVDNTAFHTFYFIKSNNVRFVHFDKPVSR